MPFLDINLFNSVFPSFYSPFGNVVFLWFYVFSLLALCILGVHDLVFSFGFLFTAISFLFFEREKNRSRTKQGKVQEELKETIASEHKEKDGP